MGPYDKNIRDFYDSTYDFNHDGKLDAFEQTMRWDDEEDEDRRFGGGIDDDDDDF